MVGPRLVWHQKLFFLYIFIYYLYFFVSLFSFCVVRPASLPDARLHVINFSDRNFIRLRSHARVWSLLAAVFDLRSILFFIFLVLTSATPLLDACPVRHKFLRPKFLTAAITRPRAPASVPCCVRSVIDLFSYASVLRTFIITPLASLVPRDTSGVRAFRALPVLRSAPVWFRSHSVWKNFLIWF